MASLFPWDFVTPAVSYGNSDRAAGRFAACVRCAQRCFLSDGVDESHHGVSVRFREIVELLRGTEGIAISAVAVPHDGFNHVSGAAVVESVVSPRVLQGNSASPERCGATPAGADVVQHEMCLLFA